MNDYDAILIRMIMEAENDPARMREIVYEVARLTVRRQINLHKPPLSSCESKRKIIELNEAIARVECSIVGADRPSCPEPHNPVTVANNSHSSTDQANPVAKGEGCAQTSTNLAQQIAHASLPIEELAPSLMKAADRYGTPRRIEESRRAHPRQAEHADDSIPRLGVPRTAREVVLVPERVRHPKPFTHPTDLVMSDGSYRLPPESRARTHLVISALAVSQLAIAAIAVAALLMSLWAHSNVVQTNAERSPVSPRTSTASLGTLFPTQLPLPRPTVYGVYALEENQLIALEQVQGAPVDPRTRNQLKIIRPSRTVISGVNLKFVVYRRGLASSAPDNVKVWVAARIAHSMIFDSNGKPAITTPETATWLIRNDHGYELHVSPVPDSAEMIELQPENPDFSYPPGRYELTLGEQTFDFVIAGEVLDPAHCVEGVATGRGPVFYECKSAQRPTPL
jgi:hypothetical protein